MPTKGELESRERRFPPTFNKESKTLIWLLIGKVEKAIAPPQGSPAAVIWCKEPMDCGVETIARESSPVAQHGLSCRGLENETCEDVTIFLKNWVPSWIPNLKDKCDLYLMGHFILARFDKYRRPMRGAFATGTWFSFQRKEHGESKIPQCFTGPSNTMQRKIRPDFLRFPELPRLKRISH
jgi:hypothetical protein